MDKYRQKGNTSNLALVSVSSNVLVLKEEEAFSLGSLVADCGGVLGLFVGFNFLMVWEWMWKFLMSVINRVNQKQLFKLDNSTKK